jgi:hypothetical protein
MEKEIKIVERGIIYFFCRPKVHGEHDREKGVQRFFLVLRPQQSEKYYLIIIGKKQLPQEKGEKYFGFLEAVKKNKDDLLQSLTEKHYETATRSKRVLPVSHCLGIGKFLIVSHNGHTHFFYQLTTPSQLKSTQKEFNLQKEGNYLISVKNPQTGSSEGVGLVEKQRANYPDFLQAKFSDHHFIPLDPADFLEYKGTEFLLIAINDKENLAAKEQKIANCLERISPDGLLEEFTKITPPEAIAPIKE